MVKGTRQRAAVRLAALLTILAFPSASGGSAENPEAPDVAGDASNAAAARYGDIVGAWIAGEDAGSVDVSIGLASFDGATGVMLYFEFEFTYKGYAFDAYSYHDVDGTWYHAVYRRDPACPLGETREDVQANGSFEGNVITVEVPKPLLETNLTLPADAPRTLDNIYIYGIDGKSPVAWDDSVKPAWQLDEAFGTRAYEFLVAAPGAELLTTVNATDESGPTPVSADTGPTSAPMAGTPTVGWAPALLAVVALASIARHRRR